MDKSSFVWQPFLKCHVISIMIYFIPWWAKIGKKENLCFKSLLIVRFDLVKLLWVATVSTVAKDTYILTYTVYQFRKVAKLCLVHSVWHVLLTENNQPNQKLASSVDMVWHIFLLFLCGCFFWFEAVMQFYINSCKVKMKEWGERRWFKQDFILFLYVSLCMYEKISFHATVVQ